jgi:hypothetical protein
MHIVYAYRRQYEFSMYMWGHISILIRIKDAPQSVYKHIRLLYFYV